MSLIKITDLSAQLGLSSRSLRYYEQIGLIHSVRPEFEKFRFFDEENIDRLKQIMVLRKMQIPIKDILRIYESEDMRTVVEVFVNRIRKIDSEVNMLSELKRIVSDFLQTMVEGGVTKISAIPLLYEEMSRQFELLEEHGPGRMGEQGAERPTSPASYKELSEVSESLAKPIEPAIISLPPMRVLSSYRRKNPRLSDPDGFGQWVQAKGLPPGRPGAHERFDFQTESGDAAILRVPAGFENDGDYLDYRIGGGLFASANIYLDEDLGERFRSLVSGFDGNKFYEIDYTPDRPAMLESLISPDEQRELVALLVPVKKRLPDPALFDAPQEAAGVSVAEIEAANPTLWEVDVPLDKLTPIGAPHYRVTENGEAEYTGWISTRVLSTNVAVKLPFRVDIEFRLAGDDEQFGYGDSEGSVIFYHGEDTGYFAGGSFGQMGFGVNMGNQAATDAWTPSPTREEALSFRQPVFQDLYRFPGRGKINRESYNRVTWIVGEKHLAAIVNGELRYCGVNFPYMSLDLSREEARSIVVGSNGQGLKYFRSIRVSQLGFAPKNKFRKEELIMTTKRSNNLIPNIHRLVTDEYGENYWFNGCAKYVMECLGEPDYDYWFFAGLTGDLFTQHYTYTKYFGDALSSYRMDENPAQFVEDTFAKCGYAATYVPLRDVRKNTEMYLQTLIAYIDKEVPVIVWGHMGRPLGVFVGYEDYGKVLLYIKGNSNQPERVSLDEALEGQAIYDGWIFVGEKKESRPLAQLYREAICAIPGRLRVKTDTYCFGSEAFRAWARDIENGKFDGMAPEKFDTWAYYTNYVCVLATNGSCCHEFLKRARELNPDMGFLEEVSALYRRTAEMWGGESDQNDADSLEALGGGFNVTLEAVQDKEKRGKIAAKIREFADVTDEIVRVLNKGINGQ